MAVNKINYGDKTLIDLTADTVAADQLMKGYTAHDKRGESITGTREFKLQTQAVTPKESRQTVSPGSGYDGLSSVVVNEIPAQYIVPSGAVTISENGTTDVTAFAAATVSVPGRFACGTVTPSGDVTSISVNTDFLPQIFAVISNGNVSYTTAHTRIMAGMGLYNGKDLNMQSFGNKFSGVAAAITRTSANGIGTLGLDGFITDNGDGTYTTAIQHYNAGGYFASGVTYGYILAG